MGQLAYLEDIEESHKIDQSQVYNGDCVVVMRDFNSRSVDCIITDPPYNLGLFMQNRNTNLIKMRNNQFAYAGWDDLEQETWEKQMKSFLLESSRILKKRGALLVFMSVIKVESFVKLAQQCGFYYKTTGIWHKTNPMPRNMNIHFVNSNECWIYFINQDTSGTFNNNGKLVLDYVETAVTPQSEKTYGKHPTQKPLSMMRYFVNLLSNRGEIVLDPFMGSGSTCVASAQCGRKYLGIELNPQYFEIAQKRLSEVNLVL
ncbi:MAG: site-specific DNA-methyltransferase [Bacteroidales bacterium]|nr:site-specific DNA-methyltransferase [Bacteroidales bacterium]